MTSFCAKCGAEVSADKQVCAACGAPTGAWTPVAASAQPVAAPGQPVAAPAQPIAPPAKSGPSALKIVLIVVAIIVGLGILGVGAFSYVIYRAVHGIHVSGSGQNAQVTMNTPGGTFTANSSEKFDASDLGTDLYPGAEAGKGGARMTLPGGSWVSAVFVTSDSKDQVVSFYKSRLGSEVSVYESADSAVLSAQKSKQESVIVTVTANKSEYNGKTQIAIVHTISTKAQ
ncbi:MAG: hypothetical protein ABSD43_11915 [Terracidiphilus sp.]